VAEVASSRSRDATPARGALGARAASPARGVRGANVSATGRERVSEIQRARIVTAITELVREGGVAGITVAHVVERSGVSRRTFYELFSDRDDCLSAAFEQALERAAATVLLVYEASGEAWEARIRASLAALLGFLDAEPAMGGLLVVDALAAHRAVLERRASVVRALIDAVHQGGIRPLGGPGRRPKRIVAEGAVGAVLAVVHARLSLQDPKPLAGLLNELMGMIVLPYRGPEAAACELRSPAPRPRRRPVAAAVPADPLRELDMRLTYRTVRVLLAIAERPGASSRGVADASGISDPGQMSKLLWRLEHLGMIANTADRPTRGEPNAWSLTAKGREVEQAIRAQTGR
jgi:AcrR family transcriptional regulator